MELESIIESTDILNILHSQFNLSDYREYFDEGQEILYDAVFSDRRDSRQYHASYFSNAKFMLTLKSNDAGKFCFCGVGGRRCKMTLFCSRCAYAQAMKKWKTYITGFERGNFYFLTISFRQDIPFNESNENFWIYWKIIRETLKKLKNLNRIRGALISDEVIVSRFRPLHLLPHSHAIIDAAEFNRELMNDLRHKVEEHSRLPVTVNVRRLNTINQFKGAIGYLYKAMDFSSKYDQAYEEASLRGEYAISDLNHEVYAVLEDLPFVLEESGMRRGARIGTFHHQTRNSLSLSQSERERNDQQLFNYIQTIPYDSREFVEDEEEV